LEPFLEEDRVGDHFFDLRADLLGASDPKDHDLGAIWDICEPETPDIDV
jgi:hypothetical protein